MRTFEQVMALTPSGDAVYSAEVTQDWAQGRASFGGIVSGLALRAMARHVDGARPLRSVNVDFAAALAPGMAQVRVEVVRTGKALTHVLGRVEQGGGTCALVQAVYGAARRSAIRVDGERAPEAPAAESIIALPYIEGVTPVFTQHFDYRWSGPGMPFTGQSTAALGGWVRHREPAILDGAAVLALIDAWPAPVLPLLDRPAPASSVTWMVNLDVLDAPAAYAPDAWWRFDAQAAFARDGYADVSGRLWDPQGRLVGTSRQLVAEFS